MFCLAPLQSFVNTSKTFLYPSVVLERILTKAGAKSVKEEVEVEEETEKAMQLVPPSGLSQLANCLISIYLLSTLTFVRN